MAKGTVDYVYDSFDEWFYETEGFSMRSERFFSHGLRPIDDVEFMTRWLKAAFECGRLEKPKYE